MNKILELDGIYKEFPDGKDKIVALKPVSFTIGEGELVAIIGPSGSGKSTLLTIMGGLQKPTGGKINFMGKDMNSMNHKERNKLRFDQIGFILQSSNLVPFLKLKEQFELVDRFGKRKQGEETADDWMEAMGILERKNLYPSQLSGGERQRAAICRALYPNPRLLLADEPTASLDTEKAVSVVKLLAEKTKGTDRSTIMVTHDVRLLEYCDRIFKITDGYLKEEK